MKQICIFLAGILAIVAAGAGVASAQAGTSPTAHAGRATEVALHRTSLGEILSTGSGVTLYEFTRDRTNSDSCIKISGCSQVWPALQSSGRPTAGTGVRKLAAVRDQAVHGRQSGHLRRSPALSLSRRQRTGRHCLRWSKRVRRILGRARCDRPGGEVDAHAHAISVVLDQRSSHARGPHGPQVPRPRAGGVAHPGRVRGQLQLEHVELLFVCRHCACKRRHLRARPARWSSRPRRTRRWARPCSSTRRV